MHGLFLQILQIFLFHMWYNWIVVGSCFWLICILVIKNQSVWMLTSCTKYQVFVSLCFSSMV